MIICAAIKDTRTGVVFGGIRHSDIYEALNKMGISLKDKEFIEGFLDSNNNFLTRVEAFQEVKKTGQISYTARMAKELERDNLLYSEDLY